MDADTERRINEGRAEAAEKRCTASDQKTASKGMTSFGSVMTTKEMEFVTEWLTSRPHLITRSLMRNGLLEQSYDDQLSKSVPASSLGKKLIGDVSGTPKFRHLPAIVVLVLLSNILPAHLKVADWLRGDKKLPIALATKALLFCLGVTANTPMPQGHKHCKYAVPLLWLARRTWVDRGKRLAKTTQATLDSDSDYFTMSDEGKVLYTLNGGKLVAFKFDLGIATDWVITDPDSYIDARLVSVDAAMDPLLARCWERDNTTLVYAEEFHFPEPDESNASDLNLEDEEKDDVQRQVDAAAAAAKSTANSSRSSGSRRPTAQQVTIPS